jgi:ABC-2 type transport system ATP-binding protein
MKMIEVQDLKKYYGDYAALGGVSFSIESGEIIGLLGLNGAGKSTILKILASFLLPSSGTAKVAGFSVEEDPDAVRRVIGFLPDEPPLYNEMTVWSYLKFVARMKDVSSGQVLEFVNRAMQQTNLIDEKNTLIGELSHGFRQRVGIAAAIVHHPKVLILDEPINGLDPVQIVEMRDLIRNLGRAYTVILSSHILSEITQTCDRILIIDQGFLVAKGSQEELLGGKQGQMMVTCVVQSMNDQVRALLKSHPQVQNFTESSLPNGITALRVDAKADIRAEIAFMIVNARVPLLEMTKESDGLERVFMGLVKTSAKGGLAR